MNIQTCANIAKPVAAKNFFHVEKKREICNVLRVRLRVSIGSREREREEMNKTATFCLSNLSVRPHALSDIQKKCQDVPNVTMVTMVAIIAT